MTRDGEEQSRQAAYAQLVERRKDCRCCAGLVNPSSNALVHLDSAQIGPWSLWQGALDAKLMVVGQDWGDTEYFKKNHGHDHPKNATSCTLMELLASIGITVAAPSPVDNGGGPLFFTNAVLCLKDGGMQAAVKPEWFEHCGSRFLRPTIEIVQPKVLVSLGEQAYRAITALYNLKRSRFRQAVEQPGGFDLGTGTRYFPRYHCGQRILNTHRSRKQQQRDWQPIGAALRQG